MVQAATDLLGLHAPASGETVKLYNQILAVTSDTEGPGPKRLLFRDSF